MIMISIVMPSYQQARYLKEALESIGDQTFTDWELIIEDGGSRDGSLQLIQSFAGRFPAKVKWRSSPDQGQVSAINQGLTKTKGDILCYLNSDDGFLPGTLETVATYFRRNPSALIVYGNADYVDQSGRHLKPYPIKPWNYSNLRETCFICQPACFWTRGVYERFGGFAEDLCCAFDYDYWLKVGKAVSFTYLPKKLSFSRYHVDAKSSALKTRAVEEAYQTVLRYYPKHLSPVWARKLATARAAKAIIPMAPGVSRLRFYTKYWTTMLGSLTEISPEEYFQWLTLLPPPYPSVLRRLQDPLADLKEKS